MSESCCHVRCNVAGPMSVWQVAAEAPGELRGGVAGAPVPMEPGCPGRRAGPHDRHQRVQPPPATPQLPCTGLRRR